MYSSIYKIDNIVTPKHHSRRQSNPEQESIKVNNDCKNSQQVNIF